MKDLVNRFFGAMNIVFIFFLKFFKKENKTIKQSTGVVEEIEATNLFYKAVDSDNAFRSLFSSLVDVYGLDQVIDSLKELSKSMDINNSLTWTFKMLTASLMRSAERSSLGVGVSDITNSAEQRDSLQEIVRLQQHMPTAKMPQKIIEAANERTIKGMKKGVWMYTVPWAMWIYKDGSCYVNEGYTVENCGGGTLEMKILKNYDGSYQVDISGCEHHDWKPSENHGFNSPDKQCYGVVKEIFTSTSKADHHSQSN